MPHPAEIVVDFCLICDDIRQESNGKFIFIGVYTNDIGIPRGIPAVSVWAALALKAPKPGKYSFEARAKFDGEIVSAIDGDFEALESALVNLSGIVVPIFGPRHSGSISVEARWSGSEWHTVRSIPVNIRNGAAADANG